jgi:hypothetical protein
LSSADSIHVNLSGVAIHACHDSRSWHWCTRSADLGVFTKGAPSRWTFLTGILADPFEWLWVLVDHDTGWIKEVLGVARLIPALNSQEALRVNLRVAEDCLGNDEIWAQSSELCHKD